VGGGVGGRDNGGNVTNVQYKPNWNFKKKENVVLKQLNN
jgi:hypothetical protein